MITPPPSRNAPCPCGSGKRYKDCHGALSTAAVAAGAAVSAARAPGDADALLAAANAAFVAGRSDEARTRIGAAIALAPTRADLHLALARIEFAAGEHVAAEAACRSAQPLAPADPASWNLLGEILRAGDEPAAIAAWRRALELDPGNAEARFHLGNVHRERNAPREAIAEYERALEAAPGHVGLLNNLGLALEAVDERDRALDCYRQVLATDPAQADALGNLANALFSRHDYYGAASAYDSLFALRRELPPAIWVRRGQTQQRTRQLAGAEASFLEADSRVPDNPTILANLGLVRIEQRRYADAEAPLARAWELAPDNVWALTMLTHGRQQRCAWDGIDSLFKTLADMLGGERELEDSATVTFPLLAMPLTPRMLGKAVRSWARGLAPAQPIAPPTLQLEPGERLRVGFVSSDFRYHPMPVLMAELWERLDRTRIAAFAYGIQPEDRGPIGQRIKRAFEHFADVSLESTTAIAQRIRDDRIAILFDMNGYTTDSRAAIFPLRPAPLQINCIGYPDTLGADWYDYIHVCPFAAPPESQAHYVERFFHMPYTHYPSDTTRAPQGPPPSRAECGLPERGFVFCCFNTPYKILPDVFAIWMRLLAAVPDSVLWLIDLTAESAANLRREAARAGIAPERLIIAPRVSNVMHVARNAAADLFLDTYPYGAHTTANDALLAGLPIVTCAGNTLVSRICGSQLHAIGLPELVTDNLADYEALALRLAQHPAELAALRARLAANRWTHPLFDMPRYARDFEDGLFRIWNEHAAGAAA